MIKVTGIYRYPIKSTAGEALAEAEVEEEGLRFDRRFMVVKPDGTFITARNHPHMQKIKALFDGDNLVLTHEQLPMLVQSRADFSLARIDTQVWKDSFSGYATNQTLDTWISQAVGEPAMLLWIGEKSPRFREKHNIHVSFADGYPLLLTATESLDDLNSRTDGSHVMAQFRPNLVVSGSDAFAEDHWQRIRIGGVEFRLVKPCARCAMVNVDQTTSSKRRDKEPLKTLATYRRDPNHGVLFGMNLIADNCGVIALNDPVEILS